MPLPLLRVEGGYRQKIIEDMPYLVAWAGPWSGTVGGKGAPNNLSPTAVI